MYSQLRTGIAVGSSTRKVSIGLDFLQALVRRSSVAVLFSFFVLFSCLQAGFATANEPLPPATASVTVGAPSAMTAPPGEVLTYSFRVQNLAPTPEPYDLTATSARGWTADIVPTLVIGASSFVDVPVFLTVPPVALWGTVDVLTVRATSVADSSQWGEGSVLTIVELRRLLSLSAPAGSSALPGTMVRYNFTLDNRGNANDTVRLFSRSSLGFLRTQPSIVQVPYFSQVTIGVNLTLNSTASAGAQDTLTLEAISLFDPSTNASARVTTSVLAVYGLRFSPIAGSSVNPGTALDYSIQVTQDGNQKEVFQVSASSLRGWEVAIVSTLELLPRATATLLVRLSVPPEAPAEQWDNLTVRLTSTLNPLFSEQIVIETRVRRVSAVGVRSMEDDIVFEPAKSLLALPLVVRVENLGNDVEKVTLSARLPLGWSIKGLTDPLVLAPGESVLRLVHVTSYESANPGNYTLSINGRLDSGPFAETLLRARVLLPKLSLGRVEFLPNTIGPGGPALLSVEIQNLGSGDARSVPITVLEGTGSSAKTSAQIVYGEVPAGESRKVILILENTPSRSLTYSVYLDLEGRVREIPGGVRVQQAELGTSPTTQGISWIELSLIGVAAIITIFLLFLLRRRA